MAKKNQQEHFFEDPPADNRSRFFDRTEFAPLAERCRPQTLDGFLGQEKILSPNAPLRKAIENDRVPSMILWGPPGSGKTTLAYLIAHLTQAQFLKLSATDSGMKDLRGIIGQAQKSKQKTILFIDEIHRWNKAQQDGLLPHVESGLITLIGATTENPSFEVIGALLSRVTVYTLETLNSEQMLHVLRKGTQLLQEEGMNIEVEDEALQAIASVSHGDARVGLNALEQAAHYQLDENRSAVLTAETISQALQEKRILYDKSGEEHYNLISALHKSLRGSDPQGALYWLARMLHAGEDPLYIARRMIRFASEDIGLAAPNALAIAIAARDAYHTLGTPEGELALAQAAAYLATAPKSNAVYAAYNEAMQAVKTHGYLPVPKHIRNAPTKLMKDLDYGKGYKYSHDYEEAFAVQDYLPEPLLGMEFYKLTERGHEKTITERMKHWKQLMEQQKNEKK